MPDDIDQLQAKADVAVVKINRAGAKMHEKGAKLSCELAIAVLAGDQRKAELIATKVLNQVEEMSKQEG